MGETDLIDRQTAIDALQKEINKGIPPFDDVMGSIRCGVRLARNIIEDLPSTEPERKTGTWVKTGQSFVYPDKFRNYMCSECGCDIEKMKYNYCPWCGAKMGV